MAALPPSTGALSVQRVPEAQFESSFVVLIELKSDAGEVSGVWVVAVGIVLEGNEETKKLEQARRLMAKKLEQAKGAIFGVCLPRVAVALVINNSANGVEMRTWDPATQLVVNLWVVQALVMLWAEDLACPAAFVASHR